MTLLKSRTKLKINSFLALVTFEIEKIEVIQNERKERFCPLFQVSENQNFKIAYLKSVKKFLAEIFLKAYKTML